MNAAAIRMVDANSADASMGNAAPKPFPWAAALHFGLGLLRLSPDCFWALSLREFVALGGALRPRPALDRATLAALMRRWPDGDQSNHERG